MVHTFGTEQLLMYITFIQVAKLHSTLLKGPEAEEEGAFCSLMNLKAW